MVGFYVARACLGFMSQSLSGKKKKCSDTRQEGEIMEQEGLSGGEGWKNSRIEKNGGWITNSKGKKSHNSIPLKEQTVIIKPT